MTCNEFQEKMVELFDTHTDAHTHAACHEHMRQCPQCRARYQELAETFQALQPRTSSARKRSPKRLWLLQSAAAVLLFTLGIMVGWNHFFATPAVANHPHSYWLTQGITSVQNVGNVQMTIYARTTPYENFAHFNSHNDFMKIHVALIRQNDSTFFRVEKDKGRTVVGNGEKQYMWIPDKLHFQGSLQANFLDAYKYILFPEQLLAMQQSAIQLSKKQNITFHETDTKAILLVKGLEKNQNLQQLLQEKKMDDCLVEVENIFSKKDGLLRSIKLWVTDQGKKTLLLYTDDICYNVQLNKAQIMALPEGENIYWKDVAQSPHLDKSRKRMLQDEKPKDAAQRILKAIITNDYSLAQEALDACYKNFFPLLTKKLKGCQISQFQVRQSEDYPGCYVFYTLTYPNGKKETQHIAIRKDNKDKIWIVDGGL